MFKFFILELYIFDVFVIVVGVWSLLSHYFILLGRERYAMFFIYLYFVGMFVDVCGCLWDGLVGMNVGFLGIL